MSPLGPSGNRRMTGPVVVRAEQGVALQREVLAALPEFWGGRDLRPLHHPVWFRQLGGAARTARTPDGRLVGYLLGTRTEELAYVHVVAVRADARGLGVGRALYGNVLAAGLPVEAVTTPGNAGSLAFHARLGFSAELVPDWAGPGEPRVLLRRSR